MRLTNITNKRIFALVVDLVFISQISVLINNIIRINYEISTFNLYETKISYGYSFMVVVYLIYFIFFDYFYNGKTIGKRIFSIYVVGKSYNLNIKQNIIRSILKVVSIIILPFSAFIFLIDNSTFHDKYFNTTTLEN
jgi:uncharacterized RDD family membrane protein YckC